MLAFIVDRRTHGWLPYFTVNNYIVRNTNRRADDQTKRRLQLGTSTTPTHSLGEGGRRPSRYCMVFDASPFTFKVWVVYMVRSFIVAVQRKSKLHMFVHGHSIQIYK